MNIIELLPNMFINISEPHGDFLQAIANIAKESDQYIVEKHFGFGHMDIVNFLPYDNLGYEDLGGQLIYTDDLKQKIRVEVRAVRWKPEHPTRSIYIEAAHHVFDNLIKAYNSRYRKRYRLRIVKDKRPSLPPKAREAFKAFIFLANKNCLHPLDWKRLYRFVRICHATRVNPHQELIRGLLRKEGFDQEKAKYISDITSHLVKFIKSK